METDSELMYEEVKKKKGKKRNDIYTSIRIELLKIHKRSVKFDI